MIVGLAFTILLVSGHSVLSLVHHHTDAASFFATLKRSFRTSAPRLPLPFRVLNGIGMAAEEDTVSHQQCKKVNWNSYEEIKALLMINMKSAMKAKNSTVLNTVKSMQAALKLREIELQNGEPLSQEAVVNVLCKLVKQRKESIACFEGGSHPELLASEKEEKRIIEMYMPPGIEEAELTKLIADTIAKEGATSVKEIGKVISALKPVLSGRADMAEVSRSVQKILSS